MFHRYVTASSGRRIDLDRAMWLMDTRLMAEAMRMAEQERDVMRFEQQRFCQRMTARMQATCKPKTFGNAVVLGRMWHHYSHLHELKYGEPFEPDVSLTWDT